MRLVPLEKRKKSESSLPTKRGHSKKAESASQEDSSPETEMAGPSILDVQPPEQRNVCGVLLWQPEQTNTLVDAVVQLSLSGHGAGWRVWRAWTVSLEGQT